MPADSLRYPHFLQQAAARSRHWLFDHALPLWWARGADHAGGGFHEKLDARGQPVGRPTRVRVQSRQVFVYARAGALGWNGPWQQAMRHGLDFMRHRHQRADGFFRSTLDTADQQVDLYDQAFVLFALAHAWQAEGQPADLLAIARRLMAQIAAHLRLPDGGYRASLDTGVTGLPSPAERQSNPLMHLLEALLAWVAVGAGEGFETQAVSLCRLAMDQLIDPATGALPEHFGEGWQPQAGAGHTHPVFEPGHQFEWAWLLVQAQHLLGSALPAAHPLAARLEHFGRRHGIDAVRDVAIFSTNAAGEALDRRARLWAQTERLRTALLFAERGLGDPADRAAIEASAMSAFQTLERFLAVPTTGLWNEWMDEDGRFPPGDAPASSFYHLMTGFDSLLAAAAPASAHAMNGTD